MISSSIRFIGLVSTVVVLAVSLGANASPSAPQVGDQFEITLTRTSTQHGSNGSSSSTNDRDTLVERVISVRPDGVEVEYDLPKETPAEERASDWKFPVRVFKPTQGPLQLLNGPELEKRVDTWLKAAGWTRAVCGHWIFTWNAFQIECDPQSALKAVEAFDLRTPALHEGDIYKDDGASSTGKLTEKSSGADDPVFAVDLPVDADVVRRAHAESDVVAGEILKKPVTLDAALQEHAKDDISGTISVTLETDATGSVYRRTEVTKLNIKKPTGESETDVITETLERHSISRNG